MRPKLIKLLYVGLTVAAASCAARAPAPAPAPAPTPTAAAPSRPPPVSVANPHTAISIRPVDMAPPATLAELRARHRLESLAACVLPDVSPDATWPALAGPDSGLSLRLPADWTRRAGEVRSGEVVFSGPSGARVTIWREVRGNVGGQYLARDSQGTPAVGVTCEVSGGVAGSIWILYEPGAVGAFSPTGAPAPVSGPPQYLALGDVITRARSRYSVRLRAPSSEERHRLVRIIASEGLRGVRAP